MLTARILYPFVSSPNISRLSGKSDSLHPLSGLFFDIKSHIRRAHRAAEDTWAVTVRTGSHCKVFSFRSNIESEWFWDLLN
jgi:hypothetical protein